MGIPSNQIGRSQKAILLNYISKQLENLIGVMYSNPVHVNPITTTTTTTSALKGSNALNSSGDIILFFIDIIIYLLLSIIL